MRRAAALVFTPLIAALAVAGCASSSSSTTAKSSASASASATATVAYQAVAVSGALNKVPTVTIPKAKGTGDLYIKTLIQGSGETLKSTTTEGAVGNYVAYVWSGATSKELGSSYSVNDQSVFAGSLLPGLSKALTGQKMGSRVLAVIPPKDAWGSAGAPSEGISGTDSLVFVIDLNQTFPYPTAVTAKQTSTGGGALPTVTAPAAGSTTGPTVKVNTKATAPKALQTKVLAKGSGAVVKKGQNIVVQYTGLIWRTGQVFETSWGDAPFSTPIGEGKVVPGWDAGLVGQTVGSRVLLVLPPAEGYGTAGNSQAGIKGTDTLVFVVDILKTY
jgi:FKBP-type peptidyl-prolyl cis-trans isomerase